MPSAPGAPWTHSSPPRRTAADTGFMARQTARVPDPIADHIAASRIGKGTRLVVTGRYAQRDWQTDHRHPTPGRPISERPTPPRHGMRGGPFPYPISRHTPQDRETDVASHGIRYRPDAATHSDIE
ncbi:Single-strand DNA-binding protein [Bifidobacterium thermophilum RBL67]|uniref:Single-strand DNA-binding protein n=2 Tax=Bifidobacterium TaxID=1678 RepID=M4RC83_9BIFI|nr:Single-strand DNA-binding protein [Bifidobacterium thermophilum RBL67]